jgi:class 3 adenylate cyclase
MKMEKMEAGNCGTRCLFKIKNNRVEEPMETLILERTIIKLGGLLALCFGESGGEIVANYVAASAAAKPGMSDAVDIMVNGRKMNVIIGFCQMRNLDDVITCLQEDALLFINQISHFVHEIVEEYSGAPNKNMGCSYMLAWRYGEAHKHRQTGADKGNVSAPVLTKAQKADEMRKLTDMAILACVKTIARIHSCPELAKYSHHEGLKAVMNDFSVDVGFGLHCGWAIESIVGSDYKIDASYLSPQVQMASSLQAATKHYDVKILISNYMMLEASPEMVSCCRMIDQVFIKKGNPPIRIYTVDLDPTPLKRSKQSHHGEHVKGNKFKIRQAREAAKAAKWCDTIHIWDEFSNCDDVAKMRAKYSSEFFKRFFTAYRNYESGEWLVARDMLFTCTFAPNYRTPPVSITEDQWPEDGPTRALLRFMQEYNFQCPPDWPGYRDLPIPTWGSVAE